MVRVIVSGCSGHMGRNVVDICEKTEGVEVVAGVDIFSDGRYPFPVFKSFSEMDAAGDVIIDFSNPAVLSSLLEYSVSNNVPAVLCTTGLTPEMIEDVKKASEKVAVLRSANMSYGVNLLIKILKSAAPALAEAGFDIDIVEKHHNQKLDAPSGTAIALADAINEACDERYTYVYDRSERRMKRPVDEIGISAVRGGTIVGDHDVIFAGVDETVTISHRAYSKAVFAKGAVLAAKYLAGKAPGLYDMSDVAGL